MTIHRQLIILGSGPAGWTAAIYAARANLRPLIITGFEQVGQLMTTAEVDNWPGDVHGLLGPDLMARMQTHAARYGTEAIFDHIKHVELSLRPFQLTGSSASYTCDALIVATGATAKYLGIESETKYRGRGVSACSTGDSFFYRGQDAVVVGGGSTAVNEALYLANLARKVYLVHRRGTLRAEKILQDELRALSKIGKVEVIFDHVIDEVLGDNSGVTGVRVQSALGNGERTIAAQGVFVAIGHQPNTQLFDGQLSMKKGYLQVHGHSEDGATQTSSKGVFAAGDVADPRYRQAITSAASGCMAALDAERFLSRPLGAEIAPAVEQAWPSHAPVGWQGPMSG